MPSLLSLGSWEAVLCRGKKAFKSERELGAGSPHLVADFGQITRYLNGNNNTYPIGLSWGLKEMHSAWNTTDLQLIVAVIIISCILLLAVYLLLFPYLCIFVYY